MFEHFTTAPAHPASSTSFNISPRDTRSPSPSPRISSSDAKQRAQSVVTELASHLDDLKRQKDYISSSYFCNCSEPLDVLINESLLAPGHTNDPEFENELTIDTDCDNDTKSTPHSSSTLRLYRCLQRQLNSQLVYSHSQIEAISEIVEEMASNNSQCNVTASSISQPPTGLSNTSMPEDLVADDNTLSNSVEDEGFCEGEVEDDELIDTEILLMNLRQASTPLGMIRRRHEYAKGAVFAKPRMRRKILRRKRPENRARNRAEAGT